MKKIIFLIIVTLMIPHYVVSAAPLVKVAEKELGFSKTFVKLERIQQKRLYDYVRLLKKRYLLTKELVWVSNKIVDGVYLQSSLLYLKGDSNENE